MQRLDIKKKLSPRLEAIETLQLSDDWAIYYPEFHKVGDFTYYMHTLARYRSGAQEFVYLYRQDAESPIVRVDVWQTIDPTYLVQARYDVESGGYLVMEGSVCTGSRPDRVENNEGVLYNPSIHPGRQIYFPRVLSYEEFRSKLAAPPEGRQIFTLSGIDEQ